MSNRMYRTHIPVSACGRKFMCVWFVCTMPKEIKRRWCSLLLCVGWECPQGITGCAWLVEPLLQEHLLSSESAWIISALRHLKDGQEVLMTDWNDPQECVFLTASMQMMEIKCSWISRYKGPGPALQKVQVAQENMLWTQEWPAYSSITACQVSEAVRAKKEQNFSPRHLPFLPVRCSWWVKISLWYDS